VAIATDAACRDGQINRAVSFNQQAEMSNLIADVGVCAVAKQQSRHLQVVIRNSVLNSMMQSRSPILNNQKVG